MKILSLKRSLRFSRGLVLESPKDFRTGYRRRMRWNKCSNSNCLRSETELEIQNRLKVHFGTYLASFCNFTWISHTFLNWNQQNKDILTLSQSNLCHSGLIRKEIPIGHKLRTVFVVPDESVVDSNEFCGQTDSTEKYSEKIVIHFSKFE